MGTGGPAGGAPHRRRALTTCRCLLPRPLVLALVLVPTLVPTLAWAGDDGYFIKTVDGMVYGPGPMPATPITDGLFTHVTVDAGLAGQVGFFNNGVAEPNIPGEQVIFGAFRGGLLSNGVPFN